VKTIVELAHLKLGWDQTYLDYPDTNQWAHHDIAATPDGRIVTGHPDGRSLLVFSPDGQHLDTVATGTVELHGIAIDGAEGDSFWVADPGEKCTPAQPEYDEFIRPGRVLNVSLTGAAVVGELHQPDLEIYENKTWRPTAVVRVRSGKGAEADETVWVSDGYGESLLHQFAADGTHLRTVDGTASGLPFDTPHALTVNPRGNASELLVADRTNRRIVVLTADGDFLRSFGSDSLTSPSGMAVMDDGTILITELFGSVAAFTGEGELIGSLGSPVPVEENRTGWPNEINGSGNTTRPPLRPGRFNSPHGICITKGAILVTEWVIGGRVVRLAPA
jgi:hypothetical protein